MDDDRKLYLGVGGGEPYPLDHYDFDECVNREASTIAQDAGSDLLEGPEQDHRDLLRDQIIEDMTRALRGPGDTYRAPDGTRYWLYEAHHAAAC